MSTPSTCTCALHSATWELWAVCGKLQWQLFRQCAGGVVAKLAGCAAVPSTRVDTRNTTSLVMRIGNVVDLPPPLISPQP